MMQPAAKWILLLATLAAAVSAKPKLRLGPTAALTAIVTSGKDGSPLSLTATNAGDGNLALAFTTAEDWLEAVSGEPVCASPSPCAYPIRILLRTAKLPRGTFTGFVIVSDPQADDAPQSISVTVTTTSEYPDQLQFYVKPGNVSPIWYHRGGTQTRGNSVDPDLKIAQQPAGGPTLSLIVRAEGTFFFNYSYQLSASAPAGTPRGDYRAAMQSNSAGRIPVAIRVSDRDPITASKDAMQFHAATGFAPQRSTLTLRPASTAVQVLSVDTRDPWLAASLIGDREIEVIASPEGLDPGIYQSGVTIRTDAANDILRIPVTLQVSPPDPALIARVGPTLGSPYSGGLARGMLATIQGELLSSGSGNARLYFNDEPIPVMDSSEYGRAVFQIPFSANAGLNLLRLDRDDVRGVTVSLPVAARNPRLLWAQTPAGTIVSSEYPPREAVKAGDTIDLIGDGFGAPTIDLASGDPAPEGALLGEPVPGVVIISYRLNLVLRPKPVWAGLAPGTIGLSKITIVIPEELRGASQVTVLLDSGGYSPINLSIE